MFLQPALKRRKTRTKTMFPIEGALNTIGTMFPTEGGLNTLGTIR